MKKIVLLFGVLCTLLNSSNAQEKNKDRLSLGQSEDNGQWSIVTKKEEEEEEKGLEIEIKGPKEGNEWIEKNTVVATDSVYYKNIVKKNGWFIGVGKALTQSEIIHLNCYYKLSKKNVAGNWTYIEALDGYGKPTTNHSIGTYLANQYDEEDKGLNNEWRNRLQTVCKWEIVASPSGKEVIQERALDSEGGVVYIFNPVKIGDREYTGSFTDSWGMPIYIRSDSLGNDVGYANFVHITRDERGYEVLFKYFDRLGFPQKNKDGAYITQKEYDDDGNQIKEASLNLVGGYMIDDYGNCGWETKFKDGRQVEYKYFNADWEPMLFPNKRGEGYKVHGFRIETDEFGRDTALIVINQEGKDAVDEDFGFQRLVKRYNNRGQQELQAFYDDKGNLVAGDKYGVAQIILEFDSCGNKLLIEYRNSENKLVNSANGYCKYKYGDYINGVNNSEIGYKISNENKLIKSFEYSRDIDGNTIRKWYTENQQRIDSVDLKGRNILTAWYDLNGIPIEFEGMHKHIKKYDEVKNVEMEIWMDKNEDPFVDEERGYSKNISITDKKNHILTNYQYMYGFLKQSFQKQFTPDFETIISQWDITPYGEHARVGWWNNLHYKCNVDYTIYGNIRTMVGRNEFDEPSYLTALGTNGEVYYFSDLNNGKRRYYDEYGLEIPDSLMEEFKAKLPKVYCIEVTDTAIAFPLGLKNGDIIISYGDWSTNQDLKTDVEYFYMEAIIKAQKPKDVTLLRHHPEMKLSEIVTCTLPAGRTSDLGFYPHKIYYTKKEKKRLLETCDKFGVSLNQYKMQKDSTILLAVQTKGGFEQTRLYHLPSYNVKDPGVVLYAKEEYDKGVDTWSMLNTIEQWDRQRMFRIKGANLHFTQDLSTTRHIDKQSQGLAGMTFVPIKVSTDIYNSLLQCYHPLEDSINSKNKYENVGYSPIKIKEKRLLGIWQTFATLGHDTIPITLEFLKEGKANFCAETEIRVDNMQIGIIVTSSGCTWSLKDGHIIIDFNKATKDCNITTFDMPGASKEEKDAMKTLLHMSLENEKEKLLENFNLSKILESDVLVVIRATSKEFVVMDGKVERTFKKTN